MEHHFLNDVDFYYEANQQMFAEYCKTHAPDGEIVFWSADPVAKIKGVDSAQTPPLSKN